MLYSHPHMALCSPILQFLDGFLHHGGGEKSGGGWAGMLWLWEGGLVWDVIVTRRMCARPKEL